MRLKNTNLVGHSEIQLFEKIQSAYSLRLFIYEQKRTNICWKHEIVTH